MHSIFSEGKEDSTSRQVHCSMQSSDSLETILDIMCTDSDTERQYVPSKFDVPGDGSCLFWAVTLAYLIPVKDDDDLFQLRYKDLVGNDETAITKLGCVRLSIQNYDPLSNNVPQDDVLAHFVRNTFRNRVVDFIESNLDKFKCFSEAADEQHRLNMRNPDIWSGDLETQAISLILNCKINIDGQIFPLVSNPKQTNHDSERITLDLFLVNRSTGDTEEANHFNYGLEEQLVKDILKKRVDSISKFCEMYPGEKREECVQEHDYNDSENNSPKNSKESDMFLSITSVFSLSNELDYGFTNELDHGFTNELDHGFTNELDHGFTNELDHGFTNELDHGFTNELDYDFTNELDHGITNELDHGITNELDHGITNELDHGFTNELEYGCTNELDYGFRQGISKEVKCETVDEWKKVEDEILKRDKKD